MPDYITKAFDSLQTSLRKELEAAEEPTFPRLVVHELRHTHATLLLRAGVPVRIVAKRLGRKDPSVTLNGVRRRHPRRRHQCRRRVLEGGVGRMSDEVRDPILAAVAITRAQLMKITGEKTTKATLEATAP